MKEHTLVVVVVVVTCTEVGWDETCCCPCTGPLWDSWDVVVTIDVGGTSLPAALILINLIYRCTC